MDLKNKIMIAILTVLIIGITFPVETIDPQAKRHVDWYKNLIKEECPEGNIKFPQQVRVTFDDLSSPVVGRCIPYGTGFVILLDNKYWGWNDETERRALVAHELTHCLFLYMHVEEPTHYMYFEVFRIKPEVLEYQVRHDLREACKGSPN